MWFQDGRGQINRIAASGAIRTFYVPGWRSGIGIYGLERGADGNLWFGVDDSTGGLLESTRVGRITPQGRVTLFSMPTGTRFATGLLAGPDGALWFAASTGKKGAIGRLDTDGVYSIFPTTYGVYNPSVVGLDGAMYFGDAPFHHLVRVSVSGKTTRFPRLAAAINVLVAGADKQIWMLYFPHSQGRLARVSPSGKLIRVPARGRSFRNIARGPGASLLALSEPLHGDLPNHLVRVAPDGSVTNYPRFGPKGLQLNEVVASRDAICAEGIYGDDLLFRIPIRR